MTTTAWRCSSGVLRILAWSCLFFSSLPLSADDAPDNSAKPVGSDPKTGIAQAVTVDSAALIYTNQLFPVDQFGHVVGKNAAAQTEVVLKQLMSLWQCYETKSLTPVKLNFYVRTDAVVVDVRRALFECWKGQPPVAVSFVQTRLPIKEAFVAVDGIAAVEPSAEPPIAARFSDPVGWRSSLLPAGPRIYISGQAEKGTDLRDATTKTLLGLKATLQNLGCDLKDVVQVKSFLTPMSEMTQAEEAIAGFFALKRTPPCVFVEWESSLPIEIELVVAARPIATSPEPLEFVTPPGMTASPVFCRVVRVNDPRTIFVSGLYSRDAGDGAAQVNDVFAQLQEILKASGSDLRHLAKATYYVSDNDVSAKLNELRPKFYDPARPPAASKAQVFGVGMTGRSLTLDMIAVPAK